MAFPPPPPPPPSPELNKDLMKVKREGRGDIQVEHDRKRKDHFLIVPVVRLSFPHSFWLLGNLIAVFIALEARRPEEQEAIGNFLEIIATNIEYISEQGFYLQELAERRQSKIDAIEKEELRSEVDELKRTVAELQDRLLSCCPSETTVQEGSSSPNNTE